MKQRKQREEEEGEKTQFYQINTLRVRLRWVFSAMYIEMSRGHVQTFPSLSNGMFHIFERLWYQPAWRHQNVAERDRDAAKSTSTLGNAWFGMEKKNMLTLPTP
jgi:hypothetical protein